MADNKKEKYAPGMDDEHELNEEATKKEKRKGEYTRVTKLTNDETDPS